MISSSGQWVVPFLILHHTGCMGDRNHVIMLSTQMFWGHQLSIYIIHLLLFLLLPCEFNLSSCTPILMLLIRKIAEHRDTDKTPKLSFMLLFFLGPPHTECRNYRHLAAVLSFKSFHLFGPINDDFLCVVGVAVGKIYPSLHPWGIMYPLLLILHALKENFWRDFPKNNVKVGSWTST